MSASCSDSGDRVAFKNVSGVYKLGENVTVRFELDSSYTWHSRDWIGLFRVGWTSNRDYYTFEWVSSKAEKQSAMSVTFSSSRLPPDDGNFYQFSYVSRSGVAQGASRPFQFSKTVNEAHSDELELVEVEEDASLLLLQSRKEAELSELQKKVVELQSKTESAEASYFEVSAFRSALEAENGKMKAELAAAKSACDAKEQTLQQLLVESGELKRQLQGSHEQVAELSKENATLNSEVQALQIKLGSQEKEHQLSKNCLQQDLDKKEKEVDDVAIRMAKVLSEMNELQHEKAEAETQLRFHCTDLEGKVRSLEEEKETLVMRMEYVKDENAKLKQVVEAQNTQIVALEADVNAMADQLGQEKVLAEELQGKLEAKEQECNVAAENLCEVMGNIHEPRDQLPKEEPVNKVEMSVVNALQLAFSDVEKRLAAEKKNSTQLRNKNAELEERIRLCGDQYLQVQNQNARLHHQIKKLGGSVSGISTPEEPNRYQEELATLQRELDEFRDKHDKRIADKNSALDRAQQELKDKDQIVNQLQVQVQVLQTEVRQLTTENKALKQRHNQPALPVQTQHQYPPVTQPVFPRPSPTYYTPPPQGGFLQPTAPPQGRFQPPHAHHSPPPPASSNASDPNTRVCPVCNTHFPKRMAHEAFEKHVNGHFKD